MASKHLAEKNQLDHENINNFLREHDVPIEENMSLEDKRDLYDVLKMSESTHLAEVKERESYLNNSQVVCESGDEDINSPCSDIDVDATQDIGSQHFKTEEKFAAERKMLGDFGCSLKLVTPPNSPSPDLILLEEIQNTSIRKESRTNGTPRASRLFLNLKVSPNHGEAASEKEGKDCSETADETSPLQNKKDDSQGNQRRIEPDEPVRNIDVWNCEEVPEKTPLLDKRPNRNHPKPFYVVPPGMNLQDYLVYFKKHINTYAENLVKSQRKSLDFVPWGPPIGVGKNCQKLNFQFDEEDSEIVFPSSQNVPTVSTSQNERYNFRGRKTIQKRANDTYITDHSSSDEDIFTKKVRKDPEATTKPIKPDNKAFDVMIGLDSPSDDMEVISADSEQPASISGSTRPTLEKGIDKWKRNKRIDSKTDKPNPVDVSYEIESDEDYQPGRKEMVKPRNTLVRNTGGTTVDVSHEIESDEDYQPGGKEIVTPRNTLVRTAIGIKRKLKEPVPIAPKPVTLVDEQSEEGWLSAKPSLVIKPGPINKNIRMPRRAVSPGSSKPKPKREKIPKLDDKQIAADLMESYEEDGSAEETKPVACPMCSQMFPFSDIEAHANNCCETSQSLLANTDADKEMDTMECPICHKEFQMGPDLQHHSQDCIAQREKRRIIPPTRACKR